MQTRTMSMIEMLTGKVAGYVVFVLAQLVILPLYYNVEVPITDNMQIGLMFSIIATFKSYGVRRFFNWLQWGRNNEQ